MYVWYPKSLGDYTGGVVCVIAASKAEAVELAVNERYPLVVCKRSYTTQERHATKRANLDIKRDRHFFRDELVKDKPRVLQHGAVIEYGGS